MENIVFLNSGKIDFDKKLDFLALKTLALLQNMILALMMKS